MLQGVQIEHPPVQLHSIPEGTPRGSEGTHRGSEGTPRGSPTSRSEDSRFSMPLGGSGSDESPDRPGESVRFILLVDVIAPGPILAFSYAWVKAAFLQ